MIRSHRRLLTAATFLFCALPALAVPTIVVGTHTLLPNQPNQVIEIRVTGGDPVDGLNFYVQVADGGPELVALGLLPAGQGIDGPAITGADLISGTIFAANNDGQQVPPGNQPQVAGFLITTDVGTVAADGLLARLTLDTTGFTSGSWPLMLADTWNGDADFAGLAAVITNGVIQIGQAVVTNQPPVVNAGVDRTVAAAASVQLSGTATDPEGAALTYAWTQLNGPTVLLSNANSLTPNLSAPAGVVNTTLVFELAVSDGQNTVRDTVSLVVGSSAQALSINAGPDQQVAEGALVQLQGTETNAASGTLTRSWTKIEGPAITLLGSDTANASFTAPTGVSNTTIVLEYRVSDGTNTAVDTVTLLINATGTGPTANAGVNQTATAGSTVTLVGSGTDPAAGALSYAWAVLSGPTVTLADPGAASTTFTAPNVAQQTPIIFELRVSSAAGTAVDTVTVTVNPAAGTGGTGGTGGDGSTDGGSGGDGTTTDTTQVTGTTYITSGLVLLALWLLFLLLLAL